MDEDPDDRDLVARHSTFSVSLVAHSRYREGAKMPAHERVLRPLLDTATECWVYGMPRSGDVARAAAGLLEPERGKHRVRLGGDVLTGRELFWNAQGGRRGTIVILTPRGNFDAERIFRGGLETFVFTNFRSAHTPAAIRFARERACAEDLVAVCLPRNNGIEWMDIHVRPAIAVELFDVARAASGSK
jgi:hypothetical protein